MRRFLPILLSLLALPALGATVPTNVVAMAGDSVTYGDNLIWAYPNILNSNYTGCLFGDIGTNGYSAQNEANQNAWGITNWLSNVAPYNKGSVSVAYGINDISNGGNPSPPYTTIATALLKIVTICRAYDPTLKIIGITVPATLFSYNGDTTREGVRFALNDWIRTNGCFDFVADIAADSRLSDASDLTYYQIDHTHPNTNGMWVIAQTIQPILTYNSLAGNDWYVSKNAGGNNRGTNWANAWTEMDQISWGSIKPGDTIWLDGGPSWSTNVYTTSLSSQSGGQNNANQLGWSIIRPGQDSAHNGLVKILGGIFMSRDYWVVDGSKNWQLRPRTVFDVPYLKTNINIECYRASNGSAAQFFQTGEKCLWINVSQAGNNDDNGIVMVDSGGHNLGNGSEIAYCWIHDIRGFGIRCEGGNVISSTYGQLNIHHNFIERVGDNYMQVAGYVDFHANYCRNQHYYLADGSPISVGHPDAVQEVNAFSRVWNNVFINQLGSRFYVEANTSLTHDILVYNNLYYSDALWFDSGSGFTNINGGGWDTNFPGTGLDLTGHDNEAGQACTVSNVWQFNNTFLQRGNYKAGQAGFSWNAGSTAGRPTATISNWWLVNNNFIGVAPYNTSLQIQCWTNRNSADNPNHYTGFDYLPGDMVVNFNSLNGFSGSGRGISYGNGGSVVLTNAYGTMSAFASAYPQYASNNNATAAYAAVDISQTNSTRYDFRPQVGDAAIAGKGTNLATLLSGIAPDVTNDIMGVPRGANWDIGAFQHPTDGAWVALTGDDSTGQGTFASPWRTIQKAANTATASGTNIYVTPGDYNEYVVTSAAGVSFHAYPANDPFNPVTTRAFSLKHQSCVIDGFKLTKSAGQSVYIWPPGSFNGSGAIITNCTFSDTPYLITHNATFGNSGTNGFVRFTTADSGSPVDFNAAGFVSGMSVYMGSDTAYAYTNCGWTPTISYVAGDGLTLFFTTNFQADAYTYFAAILGGGSGPTSAQGVYAPIGSGSGASNITIVSCLFSNRFGVAINLGPCQGSNLISRCEFVRLHGGYIFNINASNLEIANCFAHDSPNIEYWGDDELINPVFHPGGGQYYDWQCNLSINNQVGQTNVWVHDCWFQDMGNELWETDWATNATGFKFERCVFVALQMHGGLNMSGTRVDHCTFVRNAYDEAEATCFGYGNAPPRPLADGIIVSNVFVNNGGHLNLSQEGPFGTLPGYYTNLLVASNYSVFSETMGWSNTPANTVTNLAGNSLTGVFGAGDPVFANIYNPLGPDGIPFTADDGLRPLPNSPLATYSLGALPALSANVPIAHFSVAPPGIGWKDATGTNFDAAWFALRPDARPGPIRAWNTPEAIGSNSATITFSATNSIDGLGGTTNTGITGYGWTFSDGGSSNSATPLVSHTFNTAGTNWVTLWVTNSSGSYAASSNSYRLLGAGAPDTTPPSISVQPQSQSIYAGQNATFSVTASGASPLAYQWRLGGSPIAGQTTSAYATNSVALGANGNGYACVITNSYGSITSATATLTVTTAPTNSGTTFRLGPNVRWGTNVYFR